MKYFILMLMFTPLIVTNKCQSTKNQNKSNNASENTVASKLVLVDKSFDYITASKEFKVTEASIKDSLLSMKIKYTGCSDDEFDLIFTGNYLKSFPPKVNLYLSKKSGTKDCNKAMEKELFFVLTPTKYPNNKTMIVQLPAYEPKLLYNY